MLVTPLVPIQISARECLLNGQNVGLTLKMRVTWHVCDQNVTEPQVTEYPTKRYTGTVSLIGLAKA